VSFSATATSARPCLGADRKRSDKAATTMAMAHLVSMVIPVSAALNKRTWTKCLRVGARWQIKTPGLVKPGVTVYH
jgi:hypothetical protein